MTNKYQVVFPLNSEEYAHLKRDIDENGVMIPVEYDEDGNILDGHHRVQACNELGITDWPRIVRNGLSEDGKRSHARRLNLVRRQLNRAQKQELIRQELKETPEKSDGVIAAGLGVDQKTVRSTRKNMEATKEIPKLEKTTGADGKTRPRQFQNKPQDADSPATGENSKLSTTKKSSPPPSPTKGPSEKAIENAIEAITATAVPILIDSLKDGMLQPAVAKRVAQFSKIEQLFFVDSFERGTDALNSSKIATERCSDGMVAYDRQGNRHVPEHHPLQGEMFDLVRDFRLLIEAETILSQITTPPDVLRFVRRNPELVNQEVQEKISALTSQDRMRRLRVNV
jgi:ParB-like chromosome segregation protein Spo0J